VSSPPVRFHHPRLSFTKAFAFPFEFDAEPEPRWTLAVAQHVEAVAVALFAFVRLASEQVASPLRLVAVVGLAP
jgi:hypothetical protein